MFKVNVLVLGVGGNVSQGIQKAIKISGIDCNIVGACVSSDAAGLYLCDTAYISPYANSEEFIPWVVTVCNKENIHIILTGVEEIIEELARNIDVLQKKTKAVFISSDYNRLMIGRDKYNTCQWLEQNGCHYPKYCLSNDMNGIQNLTKKFGYPLIAKPRFGKGSNGIIIIKNEQDVFEVSKLENYVVEEYIGDMKSEYTVGCYCNKEGKLMNSIVLHRFLKNGMTMIATVVDDDIIKNEAEKICKAFQPRGPLNIQLRIDRYGNPVCFELNVRFSGTTSMRAHFGFNDVKAMIREYLFHDNIEKEFNIVNGTSIRYINELYIHPEEMMKLTIDNELNNVEKYENRSDSWGMSF